MAKFRVEYDRDVCIGAAACAALDPDLYEINVDGKADQKKGKEEKPGLWVWETDDLGNAQEAAEACPVNAIKIKDLENKKDIV